MVILGLFYLIISVVVMTLFCVFTKGKIIWSKIDLLAIVIVPILTWITLVYINIKPKSMSNFIEIPMLVLSVVIVGALNVAFGNKLGDKKLWFNLIMPILLALAVYFLLPTLSE